MVVRHPCTYIDHKWLDQHILTEMGHGDMGTWDRTRLKSKPWAIIEQSAVTAHHFVREISGERYVYRGST